MNYSQFQSRAGVPQAIQRRRRMDWADFVRNAILIFLLFFTFFPFLFEIKVSLQDLYQFQHSFWLPTWPPALQNYAIAWREVSRYIFNSVRVTVTSVVALVCIAILAAYVFARYSFPGRETLFYLVIGLLMIPGILTFIPRFIILRKLGLFNTVWGLILPYIAFGQPFSVLVLRSFFATIPQEILESAKIDGASEIQILLRIIVPMSYAPIILVSIIETINIYNDYLWPLLVISDDRLKTAAVGIVRFSSGYMTQYGPLMAGYMLISIPLILIFGIGMRYFVEGIASGGVKF